MQKFFGKKDNNPPIEMPNFNEEKITEQSVNLEHRRPNRADFVARLLNSPFEPLEVEELSSPEVSKNEVEQNLENRRSSSLAEYIVTRQLSKSPLEEQSSPDVDADTNTYLKNLVSK